ncbi:hypothetical protein TNCT_358531 [Trichonephila clavata]|uniref:Uncharacterized protein n=1 Tax=Trichonephila clavata TaxID=2740835 RepID=A0A8X6FL79_TRICU|nr:hypothetical protein TNCT_358531 [Trichonephila clavata]
MRIVIKDLRTCCLAEMVACRPFRSPDREFCVQVSPLLPTVWVLRAFRRSASKNTWIVSVGVDRVWAAGGRRDRLKRNDIKIHTCVVGRAAEKVTQDASRNRDDEEFLGCGVTFAAECLVIPNYSAVGTSQGFKSLPFRCGEMRDLRRRASWWVEWSETVASRNYWGSVPVVRALALGSQG